jgi:hypothetical protein
MIQLMASTAMVLCFDRIHCVPYAIATMRIVSVIIREPEGAFNSSDYGD